MFSRKTRIARVLSLLAMSLLLLVEARTAPAQTETVLYNFCSVSPNCADGYTPYSGVIKGTGGFYGTTAVGGVGGSGLVYKVSPKGKQTVLHSFPSRTGDGLLPYGPLMKDTAGNLYGTTADGGANGYGTVFELSPTGAETILYNFCSQANCTDGSYPLYPALIMDKNGNLYGTTEWGGANGHGTVFELDPTTGKETVLYSFCPTTGCPDGNNPNAGVIRDSKGNLYGTTYYGGTSDYGTVFKVTPGGEETVLHSFAGYPSDGDFPIAGLIRDSKGNLYGTTNGGGVGFQSGTVFKFTSAGAYSVLYSFCSQFNCADGGNPPGGLIMDKAGNFYGTTHGGGNLQGGGTVFKLSSGGTESVLYKFCSQPSCTDGAGPFAGVIMDSKGNLYGTTQGGGANNNGVVFKLTP